MNRTLNLILIIFPILVFGQYPFEKFKSPIYKQLKFKMTEKDNSLEYSSIVTSFFNDKSDLQIKINGNYQNSKGSYFEIKTNLKSKTYFEEVPIHGNDSLFIADFNGDGRKDIKILCSTMGCGLASLNVRVIYFYQNTNKNFTKVSFYDKMNENRFERDLNSDGKFEIITMTLQGHQNHNYWLFNVYNYENGNLICVNDKIDYPIMIQFLYRENYVITTKLTRKEMKKYQHRKPEELKIEY